MATLGALLGLASLPPPAAQTGDALLDALLADFDRRGPWPWAAEEIRRAALVTNWGSLLPFAAAGESWSGEVVKAESGILSRIDERFSADPRYWQALYLAGRLDVPEAAAAALRERELDPRVYWIEEAQRRGKADATLLRLRLEKYSAAWSIAAWRAIQDSQLSPDPSTAWPTGKWAAYETAFRAAGGTELDMQLKELLRIGAGDAAALYAAARCESERGNYATAQELIERGNRCPLVENFGARNSRFEVMAAAGTQWQAAMEESYFGEASGADNHVNYLRWKDMVRKAARAAAQRGDSAALQELHVFACRFGAGDGRDVMPQQVGLTFAAVIMKAVEEFWPAPLTATEQAWLQEHAQRRDAVKTAIKGWNPNVAAGSRSILAQLQTTGMGVPTPAQTRDWMVQLGCAALSGYDSMSALYLRDMERIAFTGRAYQTATLDPLWKELAALDYRTMDTDHGYPPAGTEERNAAGAGLAE